LEKQTKVKGKFTLPSLSRTKKIRLIVFLAALIFAGGELSSHLAFSLSTSDNYRLFYKISFNRNDKVIQGKFYLFKPKLNNFLKRAKKAYKTIILIKKASCIYPSVLTVKGYNFFCDGKLIAVAKKTYYNKYNKIVPLSHFVYNGQIPKGKIFFTGSNKNSYDSRYFGFVDKNRILYTARGLF